MAAAVREAVHEAIREIHGYPLRPEGYAEPLFHTRESRQQILDHLARSGWLFRASQSGRLKRPCPKRNAPVNLSGHKVLASWREVDRWWEPDGGIDAIWRLVESDSGRQDVVRAGLVEFVRSETRPPGRAS